MQRKRGELELGEAEDLWGSTRIPGHLMEGEYKPIWAIHSRENYTSPYISETYTGDGEEAGSGKQVNKSLNTQNRSCK
jgi:hypothetical protein